MKSVIIDGNNACFRSLTSRGVRTMQGMTLTKNDKQELVATIIFGLLNLIIKIAMEEQTNDFIFCWDTKESLRRDRYPFYKSKRRYEKSRLPHNPASGEDFLKIGKRTFDFLRTEILPYIGLMNQFHHPGYEADDLIAQIVDTYLEDEFLVVSNDKDLYQLLDRCRIWNYRNKIYTREMFISEFGVEPAQWLSVKAIAGDWSDYIDGIDQVAIKTAVKFVNGTLGKNTKAYMNIISEEGREIVSRNKWLMKIPHPGTPQIELYENDLSLQRFLSLCNRYGFDAFLTGRKLEQWKHFFDGTL